MGKGKLFTVIFPFCQLFNIKQGQAMRGSRPGKAQIQKRALSNVVSLPFCSNLPDQRTALSNEVSLSFLS